MSQVIFFAKDQQQMIDKQYLCSVLQLNLDKMTQEKFLSILGWVATATAMAMYISYIPQISSNLSGHKGDWLQPMVAGINCVLWVGYGFIRKKKDWPIVIANFPGVVCGFLASFTAL